MCLSAYRAKAGSVGPAVLAALLVGSLGAEAHAQRLRTSTPTGGSFGGITNVGKIANTSVSRNFAPMTPGAGAESQPPMTAPNAGLTGFGIGRRGRAGLDLVATTSAQRRSTELRNLWHRGLSPFGAARYFQSPPNYRAIGAPDATGYRALQARLLLSPHDLLRTTAFTAPAYNAGITLGRIHDPLSMRDNTSEVRISSDMVSPVKRHSQADLMESRLASMRKRILQEGWAWFQKADYQRAYASFKNAERLDRTDPEPRAGMFFCCLAGRKHLQTTQTASRIIAWDANAGIFEADYRLEELCAPPDEEDPKVRLEKGHERVVKNLNALLRFAGEKPPPRRLAAVAYALWHSGYKSEAIRAARALQARAPGSAYDRFARRMIEASERENAGRPG